MSVSDKKVDNGVNNGSELDLLPSSTPTKKPIESWSYMIQAWPKATFCIMGYQFFEVVSDGMSAVLTLYLLNVLKFSYNSSTVFFHSFNFIIHTAPLLGSFMADGYIGKFRTILYFSLLLAGGQAILAVSSMQTSTSSLHPMLDIASLIIIALGNGAMRCCVSPFGGDQFKLGQVRMLSIYFSMFYFSSNLGATLFFYFTPVFRSQSCMGQDSCYPLAFGAPAALILLATVIFLTGSFWYKKISPTENIVYEVFRVIKQALANKRFFNVKREHWLDHYLDSHSCDHDEKCLELKKTGKSNVCQKRHLVHDIKSLFRVIVMLLPVPFFWALYNQQGSRWEIQSLAMDSRLWGDAMLLPDQMQALNPVVIFVLIPITQVVIYPLFGKCFKLTHLRKMVCGGLLACVAFVLSAAVQFRINTTLPDIPQENHAYLSFVNTLQDCWITITPPTTLNPSLNAYNLSANTALYNDKSKNIHQVYDIPSGQSFNWTIGTNCANVPWGPSFVFTSDALKSKTSFYVVVGTHGAYMTQANSAKPTEGRGEFSLSVNMAMDVTYVGNLALCRREDNATNPLFPCDPNNSENFYYWQLDYNDGTTDLGTNPNDNKLNNKTISWSGPNNGQNTLQVSAYAYKHVRAGSWDLYFMEKRAKDFDHKTPDRTDLPVNYTGISVEIKEQGGVYALIITNDRSKNVKSIYQIVPPNQVSILWQIPQFALLALAEIVFNITGYEFVYSQAAPTMKALIVSLWQLNIAIGDVIVVLITLLKLFDNMAIELLFYAALMVVVMIVFALIAAFYFEYRDYTAYEANDRDDSAIEKDIANGKAKY